MPLNTKKKNKMKNFFLKIFFVIILCFICYLAGINNRPIATPNIIETTIIDTIYDQSVPDSGAIYAALKFRDTTLINSGILQGELKNKTTMIDSLYSKIEDMLQEKEIIAHTTIDVTEGSMDVDYFLSKKLFEWNWDPRNKLKEIQIIKIEIPVYMEKKWYERWYVTMPLGILIGYGMEKVL